MKLDCLEDLEESQDVVINCTGLGSARLGRSFFHNKTTFNNHLSFMYRSCIGINNL